MERICAQRRFHGTNHGAHGDTEGTDPICAQRRFQKGFHHKWALINTDEY